MQNRIYCKNCGKANLYETEKPNCCGYCSKSLSFETSVASKPTFTYQEQPKQIFKKQVVEEDEDENVDIYSLTNLSAELEGETQLPGTFNSIGTVGRVAFTSQKVNDTGRRPEKISHKKALSQILSQGKAINEKTKSISFKPENNKE